MDITYERNVEHCEPTTYARVLGIAAVEPALNSDNLDSISLDSVLWRAIAQRGKYKPGDRVMFIPPETVLPLELSELIGVTKFLSKGKVKAIRLRGNRSEGLIVDADIVEPFIPYLMQWETPMSQGMFGMMMKNADVPYMFHIFYKIPNLMNVPDELVVGERIGYSEKIHGTNCRFGILPHPGTGEYQLYVGTHKTVRKSEGKCLYWKAVEKHVPIDKLPNDTIFYGEIYGKGVQDLHYDVVVPQIKIFAIVQNGNYLPPFRVTEICDQVGLDCVKFHYATYESPEWAMELSDSPSEVWSGMREGIVIVADDNPHRMVKVVSLKYLNRGGRKTEGH